MAETQHPGNETAGAVDLADPERARRNLESIASRVPAGVAAAIPALLSDAPDRDAALNLFERLTGTASPELFRTLERQRALIHYALLVFGYSDYLGETLVKAPELFQALAREHALDRSHSREEFREAFARFRSRSFDNDIAVLLARFKRREYVRILLRDVLGIATLAEVTAEVSSLADVLIEEALRETQAAFLNRYGTPRYRDIEGRLVDVPVSVLSLGKLGGNELNYSSDIDLLFLYGEGVDAGTATISNREYFIRLAQTVTDVLSRLTSEGSTFRVDLRLRPQGGEGEPAVSISHALDYYENVAADWELQAMIKVRHSAGDVALARRFIRGVQPFVYRGGEQAALNFVAIETALEARDRITLHHRRAARPAGIDVKVDRGGIRDIEFLVQCLQRVYGGGEPWLRSGGTLFSLQKLHDKGHITGRDFHELTTAYEFLRQIEHRLQIRHGQQTHRIPSADADLTILARSVNPQASSHDPRRFVRSLEQRMAAVTAIYQRIIHGAQMEQQPTSAELFLSEVRDVREHSERQMLHRLAQDAPELFEIVRAAPSGSAERRNVFRFLSAAFTSSDRYAAVLRAPKGLARAMRLFALSDFTTELLLGHPDEIATLEDLDAHPSNGGTNSLFDPELPVDTASPAFSYVASPEFSYSDKLALLRQQFRHRVFASAAHDVIEPRAVFYSLETTTNAADEAISAAVTALGSLGGFAVLAMGRLGTREFDLLSDADLVFVRDDALENSKAVRFAEQLMHALAAYTREGSVFAVDTRLRPRGGEGELVISATQLREYFRREASPWEALSFTKLRFVSGCGEVGIEALEAVDELSTRYSADANFIASIRDMRRRLEQSAGHELNLKLSAGGMYDVDFVAKYLTVRAGHGVQTQNIRKRLEWLVSQGLLEPGTGSELAQIGELIRTVEHAVRLATGRSRATLPVGEHAHHATEALLEASLRRKLPLGIEPELRRAMARAREIYDHIVR